MGVIVLCRQRCARRITGRDGQLVTGAESSQTVRSLARFEFVRTERGFRASKLASFPSSASKSKQCEDTHWSLQRDSPKQSSQRRWHQYQGIFCQRLRRVCQNRRRRDRSHQKHTQHATIQRRESRAGRVCLRRARPRRATVGMCYSLFPQLFRSTVFSLDLPGTSYSRGDNGRWVVREQSCGVNGLRKGFFRPTALSAAGVSDITISPCERTMCVTTTQRRLLLLHVSSLRGGYP